MTYRKFIFDYACAVLELDRYKLECDDFAASDSTRTIKKHIHRLKKQILALTGEEFPQDANKQLHSAIKAIFRSWNLPRAKSYRKLGGISDEPGTAVIVQQMVFGSIDANSGAGVVFSKNPITGENEIYGEYLPKAQGDAIASGMENPTPFANMKAQHEKIHESIVKITGLLEEHFKWAQNIEFTYEKGKLYILQA